VVSNDELAAPEAATPGMSLPAARTALAVLAACDETVAGADVYVPGQANVRSIIHAVERLGFPTEKVVVNVDRFGNTSSGSIPLALGGADAHGLLQPGKLVLVTGMGAGLTWGSALIERTRPRDGVTP
jgi:3-oxoacyl-[acyl-carrier-protein] synthase-3